MSALTVRGRWEDRVTLVPADMRNWRAPEQADIVVSELLGSFGDNELSPECLDGAQSCLKPDGISIPSSYTSYLQPITTAKLWNDVKVRNSPLPLHHYNYSDLMHFLHHLHFLPLRPLLAHIIH